MWFYCQYRVTHTSNFVKAFQHLKYQDLSLHQIYRIFQSNRKHKMTKQNALFKQTVQQNMKSIFSSSAHALSSGQGRNPFKAFASQANLQRQQKLKQTLNIVERFDQIPQNKNFLAKLYKKQRKIIRDPIIRKTDLGSTDQTFNEKQLDVLELIEKGFMINQDTKANHSYLDQKKFKDQENNLVKMMSSLSKQYQNTGIKFQNTSKQNYTVHKKSNKKESKALVFQQHRKTTKKYSKITQMLKYKISDFFVDDLANTKEQKENKCHKESHREFQSSIFYGSKFSQQHASNYQDNKLKGGYTVAACMENAQKKIARMPPSVFLTKQRKQALYQCQVLRSLQKLKRQRKCQLQMIENHLSTSENKSYQEQQQMNYSSLKDHVFEMAEAGQILKKNYNRIKKERKRVIEKLKL